MTKINIDLGKSIEENASVYYEKAKKARKKMKGAEEALEKSLIKLYKLKEKEKKEAVEIKEAVFEKPRKQEWYEKFRWFISSEGFLVIGGRDATSNEIIIKKHTEANDLVFHTDMAGSPFFVVKAKNKKIGMQTIKEAADATCSYSRAWRLGLTTTSVFYVNPEQVTKEAKSGEYLTRGAFMIKGKTNYIANKINCAVGITKDSRIIGGPLEAVRKNCKSFVEVQQGKEKTSKVAKAIISKIGGNLDEIIRALPAGGCEVKK